MKDEIKEILDYLKDFVKEDRLEQINLNRRFISSLLDYITNLQEENKRLKEKNKLTPDELINMLNQELVRQNKNYKSRNEKANNLLNEMLERAYIDGEYIMYDYSTSELLEVKQALQGEDKE